MQAKIDSSPNEVYEFLLSNIKKHCNLRRNLLPKSGRNSNTNKKSVAVLMFPRVIKVSERNTAILLNYRKFSLSQPLLTYWPHFLCILLRSKAYKTNLVSSSNAREDKNN